MEAKFMNQLFLCKGRNKEKQ